MPFIADKKPDEATVLPNPYSVPSAPDPTLSGRFVPDKQAPAPSATFAGQPVSPSLQGPADMATSAAQGFNKHLAGILGAPVAAVQNVFNSAAALFNGKPADLRTSGDATSSILDAMDAAGMGTRAKAVYPFLEHVGSEALSQMLIAAGGLAAAPELAAMTTTGTGVGSALKSGAQQMAEFGMKHPASVVGGALGGAVGGPAGEVLVPGAVNALNSAQGLPPASPALESALQQIGGFGGSMIGGGIGGGIMGIGRAGGQGSPKLGGAFADEAMGGRPTMPVATPGADLDPMARRIAAIQNDIQSTFDKAYATVHTPEDTVTAAQKLRSAIRTASAQANRQIKGAWNAVDQTQTMDLSQTGIKAIPGQIMSKIVNPAVESANVPTTILSAIKKLPAFPELRNVRAIMSEAMQEVRRIPKVGEAANDKKKAFLNEIVDGLKAGIDQAFPNDPALRAANNLTKWFHDTFDRSAIAPLAQRRMANEAGLKDAAPLANRLVQSETGGQRLAGLESARPMTGETPIAAPADQFIRAQLAAEAEKRGPVKGALWLQSPAVRRFTQQFPTLDRMAQQFNSIIQPAIDEAQAIAGNKFLAKVGESPDAAVTGLFRSADPEAATKAVTARLGSDPAAMDALHNGVIAKMFRDTDLDPDKLANWFGQARNKTILEEAFRDDPTKLARLNRIVHSGIALAGGDQSAGGKAAQFAATIAGKVIGSSLFMMLPGNELIMAGAGAKLGRSLSDRVFSVYSPQALMSEAVKDPRWEALLFSRVPSNLKAMRELNQRLAQLAGSTRHVFGPSQIQDTNDETSPTP